MGVPADTPPRLVSVLSKPQGFDPSSHLTLCCTPVCDPPSAHPVRPPVTFFCPKSSSPPLSVWLTPTSPLSSQFGYPSSWKPLTSHTGLDAGLCTPEPPPSERLALFIAHFMACLCPTRSLASQGQVPSLPCSPRCTQALQISVERTVKAYSSNNGLNHK